MWIVQPVHGSLHLLCVFIVTYASIAWWHFIHSLTFIHSFARSWFYNATAVRGALWWLRQNHSVNYANHQHWRHSDFSVFSPQKIIWGLAPILVRRCQLHSPLSFDKSFMKIRSAVPENGCLIFFDGRKKNKKKQKKQKKTCKTYTHSPRRRLRELLIIYLLSVCMSVLLHYEPCENAIVKNYWNTSTFDQVIDKIKRLPSVFWRSTKTQLRLSLIQAIRPVTDDQYVSTRVTVTRIFACVSCILTSEIWTEWQLFCAVVDPRFCKGAVSGLVETTRGGVWVSRDCRLHLSPEIKLAYFV